jgi:hypothetical protein
MLSKAMRALPTNIRDIEEKILASEQEDSEAA